MMSPTGKAARGLRRFLPQNLDVDDTLNSLASQTVHSESTRFSNGGTSFLRGTEIHTQAAGREQPLPKSRLDTWKENMDANASPVSVATDHSLINKISFDYIQKCTCPDTLFNIISYLKSKGTFALLVGEAEKRLQEIEKPSEEASCRMSLSPMSSIGFKSPSQPQMRNRKEQVQQQENQNLQDQVSQLRDQLQDAVHHETQIRSRLHEQQQASDSELQRLQMQLRELSLSRDEEQKRFASNKTAFEKELSSVNRFVARLDQQVHDLKTKLVHQEESKLELEREIHGVTKERDDMLHRLQKGTDTWRNINSKSQRRKIIDDLMKSTLVSRSAVDATAKALADSEKERSRAQAEHISDRHRFQLTLKEKNQEISRLLKKVEVTEERLREVESQYASHQHKYLEEKAEWKKSESAFKSMRRKLLRNDSSAVPMGLFRKVKEDLDASRAEIIKLRQLVRQSDYPKVAAKRAPKVRPFSKALYPGKVAKKDVGSLRSALGLNEKQLPREKGKVEVAEKVVRPSDQKRRQIDPSGGKVISSKPTIIFDKENTQSDGNKCIRFQIVRNKFGSKKALSDELKRKRSPHRLAIT